MKVVSIKEIKENILTLDLSDEEYNILFRMGLQLLLDEWFGKKVVVLPVDEFKITKKTKTVEFDDEISNLCVETCINQILREYIDKAEKGSEGKKIKKNKRQNPFHDAADFA
jgi:hypothetical protein